MKIKIVLIFLLAIITFSSCNKDEEINSPFNATVLREGDKCGAGNDTSTLDFLIEFNENFDNLPVQDERIYYASNLPEEFRAEGLQVTITFREPNYENTEEVMFCDTVTGGDDFPQIWVISVE